MPANNRTCGRSIYKGQPASVGRSKATRSTDSRTLESYEFEPDTLCLISDFGRLVVLAFAVGLSQRGVLPIQIAIALVHSLFNPEYLDGTLAGGLRITHQGNLRRWRERFHTFLRGMLDEGKLTASMLVSDPSEPELRPGPCIRLDHPIVGGRATGANVPLTIAPAEFGPVVLDRLSQLGLVVVLAFASGISRQGNSPIQIAIALAHGCLFRSGHSAHAVARGIGVSDQRNVTNWCRRFRGFLDEMFTPKRREVLDLSPLLRPGTR